MLNPAAPRIAVSNGEVAPDSLFGAGLYDPATKTPDVGRWLREEAYHAAAHADGNDHDHDR
jgi:G3E family GTPase